MDEPFYKFLLGILKISIILLFIKILIDIFITYLPITKAKIIDSTFEKKNYSHYRELNPRMASYILVEGSKILIHIKYEYYVKNIKYLSSFNFEDTSDNLNMMLYKKIILLIFVISRYYHQLILFS